MIREDKRNGMKCNKQEGRELHPFFLSSFLTFFLPLFFLLISLSLSSYISHAYIIYTHSHTFSFSPLFLFHLLLASSPLLSSSSSPSPFSKVETERRLKNQDKLLYVPTDHGKEISDDELETTYLRNAQVRTYNTLHYAL